MITALFELDSMKEQQKIFCFFVFPEKTDIELINSHFSVCIKKLKARQGENKEESSYNVTNWISIHNQEVLYYFKSYHHAGILFKRKKKREFTSVAGT